MGVMKLMMLLLVLFNFTFHASFAHLDNNLYSGNPKEKVRETLQTNESDVSVRKFAHAAGARGGGEGGHSAGEAGGHSAGERGNGNGGAVIPVYAASAGAASQRKNHHGAAGLCRRCPKDHRLLIIVATIPTSFLLHIPM